MLVKFQKLRIMLMKFPKQKQNRFRILNRRWSNRSHPENPESSLETLWGWVLSSISQFISTINRFPCIIKVLFFSHFTSLLDRCILTSSSTSVCVWERERLWEKVKMDEPWTLKCVLLFVQILNQRAIEASDEARPTPNIRTGDVVEIRLVIFFKKNKMFLRRVLGWDEFYFMVIYFCPAYRKFLRTGVGCQFIKVLSSQNKMLVFTQLFESEELLLAQGLR